MTPQVETWPVLPPTLEQLNCVPPEDLIVEDAHLITEDDSPVDNLYSERLMKLLTESLYVSRWTDRKFLACADVGIFMTNQNPAIVPDVFVSMDVEPFPDLFAKAGRSYLVWEKGKLPELVIEIVSNDEGNELTDKRRIYGEQLHVPYYVVWDPEEFLKADRLTVLKWNGEQYLPTPDAWFPLLGLGLRTWDGTYQGIEDEWLRWVDQNGNLLPIGQEEANRAESERQRAETERQKAESERQRAEAERRRADEATQQLADLMARMREQGLDPDQFAR